MTRDKSKRKKQINRYGVPVFLGGGFGGAGEEDDGVAGSGDGGARAWQGAGEGWLASWDKCTFEEDERFTRVRVNRSIRMLAVKWNSI